MIMGAVSLILLWSPPLAISRPFTRRCPCGLKQTLPPLSLAFLQNSKVPCCSIQLRLKTNPLPSVPGHCVRNVWVDQRVSVWCVCTGPTTSTPGLCYFIIKQKARQTEWTNDTVMNLSRSNNGIDKQIQFCLCLWREEELEETQKKNKACLSARSTI